MELKFTIDTEELYGEDGIQIEDIVLMELKKTILNDARNEIKAERFNEFADAVKDEIIAGVKRKMVTFLTEEIVLTDKWGKKTFIGSVDDLIKKRFDDVLLRPVDNRGETLQGCTTSSQTWIEWSIEHTLKGWVEVKIKDAKLTLEKTITSHVSSELNRIMAEDIKGKVTDAFHAILSKK